MSLFKEFASAGKTRPMMTWISQGGDIAVIVDASRCAEPQEVVSSWREFLEASEEKAAGNGAGLWQELCARGAETVDLGLFRKVADGIEFLRRGETGCFRFADGTMVSEGEGVISLGRDDVVLAVTGSVDASLLAHDVDGVGRAQTTTQFVALADAAAQGREWAMLVFPFERRASFIDPNWPYNPFVGYQEDRDHEKCGLADIASALFREPGFEGFRIVGGQHLSTGAGSRNVDGFLVCRWGVYPLELKHYHGKGVLYPKSKNVPFQFSTGPSLLAPKENPVLNLEEVVLRKGFSNLSLGVEIMRQFRKMALLVFTHPKLYLSVVHDNGETTGIPCSSGSVLICTPGTIAQSIRKYLGAVLNVKKQLLTDDIVNAIVAHLGSGGAAPVAEEKPPGRYLQLGRFQIAQEANPAESTSLYQVFDGISDSGKRVWAKRFDLTTMGVGGGLEPEETRLGREAPALQDLGGVAGVQRYFDRFTRGLHHYVIVQQVPGLTLDCWLEEKKPEREERLTVLVRLAVILSHLAAEPVVHRAVNPFNVRIGEDGFPRLINFEVCQIPTLLTVVPRGREVMDRSYQPREALATGSSVSAGTDTYSFGKICCQVLAGELPFEFYHEVQKTRKPGFWERFGEKCGLNPGQAKELQKMMSNEQAARPVGQELVSIVKGWC